MNNSGSNVLFRSALLILNIALLGSMAAHIHFGFDLRELISKDPDSAKNKEAKATKDTDEANQSKVDLNKNGQLNVSKESTEDTIRGQRDGSRVSRMQDGYGNSTVTRNFGNHKLLRMVLVRFRANGERTVFVYGKNGEVKTLPENYYDRVLSASADEIASAAKIFDSQNPNEQRKQRLASMLERLAEARRESEEMNSAASEADDGVTANEDSEIDQVEPEL